MVLTNLYFAKTKIVTVSFINHKVLLSTKFTEAKIMILAVYLF
jgi:hypothetical protein